MVNSVFGALWLLSCIFSSLGTINQIKHNCNRRSVSGLSLFDSEIRLYGKIASGLLIGGSFLLKGLEFYLH
jgi:hypothetical protein